jgi:hypothetical protein
MASPRRLVRRSTFKKGFTNLSKKNESLPLPEWSHFTGARHLLNGAIPTAQRAVIIQPRAAPWVSISKHASGLKGRDL